MRKKQCSAEEVSFFGSSESLIKELRRWSVGRSKKFEQLGLVDDRDGASILAAAAATISRLSMTLDGKPMASAENKKAEKQEQSSLFDERGTELLDAYRDMYDFISNFVEEEHASAIMPPSLYKPMLRRLELCQDAEQRFSGDLCPHCHKKINR